MKKKILFLLHYPPPVHGSSMVGQWIKGSNVINNSFECFYINLLASKSVKSSGKVSIIKILGFIKICFRLLSTLVLKRPHVVYFALTTTGVAFYKDMLIVCLLRIFHVKRIYHLHNKGIKQYSTNKLKRLFYHFAFKNASVIILSKNLYEDIAEYVFENKVFICPNGIPQLSSTLNEIKITNKTVIILFLSNLIESKGVFVLLQAMKLLKDKNNIFKGVFIGSEGDVSLLRFEEEVQRLGLIQQVSYEGTKYGKEKEKIFEKADIFAFPTYHETFGLVNLEAMQHGLPIVSTYEGGIPDVVEDGVTGYLVPQRDVKALADKLEILINNPELRKKFGDNGRKKYLEQFTLSKFENRMVSILSEVLDN